MKREFRDRWVAALRSGEFQQGIGRLVQKRSDGLSHCCLGVLCELDDKLTRYVVRSETMEFIEISYSEDPFSEDFSSGGMPDGGVLGRWGLHEALAEELAKMNDSREYSFTDIADWIEENIPVED